MLSKMEDGMLTGAVLAPLGFFLGFFAVIILGIAVPLWILDWII